MLGLMQDWKLVVPTIIDHAARWHGDQKVVTRSVEGPMRETTYAQIADRSRQVAKALIAKGVAKGDRIATMAWNTDRHLEAWYGIMGIGAICHTLNPRLFPEQVAYIVNHAQDKLIMTDTTFLPLFEALGDKLPSVEGYIVLTDQAHMPETKLANAVSYEEWIGGVDTDFQWADVDENDACGLCYTSGTTGHPKGVLYSHRSNVLHAMTATSADALACRANDSILPVVPMFHANAWGLSFSGPMVGAQLVMPGPRLDGASVHELVETYKVTQSAAVPTVWMMLLQHLREAKANLTTLKRVVIGGAACPQALIEAFDKEFGVEVVHAWGMTETSPLGTVASPKSGFDELEAEAQMSVRLSQGRNPYLVDLCLKDDEGNVLPHDGKTPGRLMVKGPFIASAYFRDDRPILDGDGYFDTGDVATIDGAGYMRITDRAKDLIKSGGEWISSIELENEAVSHPAVAEAAVIGRPHPKWDERPLMIIVLQEGKELTKDEMIAHLEPRVAKWWLPDDVVFVDSIPHTATAKISKKDLREQFKDYELPTVA